MTPQTSDLHVNPSEETIRLGPLTVRFLVTAENSSHSIAAFEVIPHKYCRVFTPFDSEFGAMAIAIRVGPIFQEYLRPSQVRQVLLAFR